VYAYDPGADTWTALAPISAGRGAFVGVTTGSDGRIYAIGGTDCCFDFTNANVVQAYTPATNSWATVPPTEDAHPASGVAAADGHVFVVNSVDQGFNEIANVEAYTPAKVSTTSLTSSANPATAGSNVTLTATVVPNSASGAVTFMDGGVPLATVSVGKGGIATFTTSSLSVGSHTLTAAYSGNATYGGSTSLAVTQVIQ
jgi:N-acetylneuraminic acid mutarotase